MIGTTSPNDKLQVVGNISGDSLSVGPYLTGYNAGIELDNSSGTSTVPYIDFHYGTGSAQDYNTRIINSGNNRLDFTNWVGTPLSLNAGNVGIGTAAPGTKLAVNGSLASNNSPLSVLISKSASWILTYNSNIIGLTWNSFNGGDPATGTLKLGYVTLGSKLHMLLSGGGATNGALKVIKLVRASDNTVLINTNLGTLTGVNNNSSPTGSVIDTSAYSGETVYLQLEDNDAGGTWGWIALFLNSVFVEP